MLDVKQLRMFKTIVEVGSITGAAEHLELSQPAISQQLRALEEALGVSLLVRVGKGTRPTPAGELLLEFARQILEKIDEAERTLGDHRRGRAGLVRLGTPEPPCNYVLPSVLLELKRRAPRIDIRVVSGHTGATLSRLQAGEIDLALLPLPVDAGRLRLLEVGRDELVAVAPPAHAIVGQPWISARDLESYPIVLYDRQSQITDLTLAFLLEEGVFPRVAVEIDHVEAIKHVVREGIGVAVVPAWAVREEVATGTLASVRLGPRGLLRTWGLLYPDHAPLPVVLRTVVAVLAETLPPLFATGSRTIAAAETGVAARDS
jgi:LysR family transcriptional activator of glutamate synthase operon